MCELADLKINDYKVAVMKTLTALAEACLADPSAIPPARRASAAAKTDETDPAEFHGYSHPRESASSPHSAFNRIFTSGGGAENP